MNVDALNTAISELNSALAELQETDAPSIDDLIEWGRRIPELTYSLVYVGRALRDHVLELGNLYELSDDRGRPPEESLIETADALRALMTLLERADPAAREYGDSIAHITVERPLEPGEPPSLEVRPSTAANMARRSTPTTHVAMEPYSLMNDTISISRRRP